MLHFPSYSVLPNLDYSVYASATTPSAPTLRPSAPGLSFILCATPPFLLG